MDVVTGIREDEVIVTASYLKMLKTRVSNLQHENNTLHDVLVQRDNEIVSLHKEISGIKWW